MLGTNKGAQALGDRTNTDALPREENGQGAKDVVVCACGAAVKHTSFSAHTKTKKHLAFVQQQAAVLPATGIDRSNAALPNVPPAAMIAHEMQPQHMQGMHPEYARYLQWQQMQAFHAQAAYFSQTQNYLYQQSSFPLQQSIQQPCLDSAPQQPDIYNNDNQPAGNGISSGFPQKGVVEDSLCSALASVQLDQAKTVHVNAETNSPVYNQDAKQTLDAMVQTLSKAGIPVLQREKLTFGKEIGRGAFGAVHQGSMQEGATTIKVAIKTLLASGEEFSSLLADFEREAIAGWRASEAGRQGHCSRIAMTLGVSVEVMEQKQKQNSKQKQKHTKSQKENVKVKLHLVLQLAEARGTLHDEFAREEHIGAQVTKEERATKLVVEDADGLAFLYTMPRNDKVHVARELAAILVELQQAGVVHNDIKPSNLLVVASSSSAASTAAHPRGLLMIDFGEGELVSAAGGKKVRRDEEEEEWESPGTPGYQAPEVFHAGHTSFASDVYSAGVAMLEVCIGDLWESAEEEDDGTEEDEEDEEDFEVTRKQVSAALEKLSSADAALGGIIARCLSLSPPHRPSPPELLSLLQAVRTQ